MRGMPGPRDELASPITSAVKDGAGWANDIRNLVRRLRTT